jgi:predicted small secreted protein
LIWSYGSVVIVEMPKECSQANTMNLQRLNPILVNLKPNCSAVTNRLACHFRRIDMNKFARQLCAWLIMAAGCVWMASQLTACNTVKGAGEDVQSVGRGVEGAAQGADNAD